VKHRIGQPGNARQTVAVIQIAMDGGGSQRLQSGDAGAAAHQCVHAVAPEQQGNNTQCNIPAANDENALHAPIMR
jgi:hypothetical protein